MTRRDAVLLVTAALLSNPERYKYITGLVEEGMSNDEATAKNVAKAGMSVDCIEKFEGEFPIGPGGRPKHYETKQRH